MRLNDNIQRNPVMTTWILNAFLPNHLVNFCPFNCRIKTSDSTDTARKTETTVKTNTVEFSTFLPEIHSLVAVGCQSRAPSQLELFKSVALSRLKVNLKRSISSGRFSLETLPNKYYHLNSF